MKKITLATAVLTAAAFAAPSVTFGQTAQLERAGAQAGQAAETTADTVNEVGTQVGDAAQTAGARPATPTPPATPATPTRSATPPAGGMPGGMAPGQSMQSMQMKTKEGTSVMPSEAKKPQMSAEQKKTAAEEFMKAAYSANMLEAEAGKYVEENVDDPAIRALAHVTATQHAQANDQLKQVAQQANVQLPTGLMPPHQAVLDAMKKKQGEMLANAYMLDQTGNHIKAVLMYDVASKNDAVPAAQQYARQTLPKIKEHTKMILAIDEARFGTDPTQAVEGGMSTGMPGM